MSRFLTKTCAVVALAAVGALPAQAMTFPIGLEITSASPGNPFGATVGTVAGAGAGDIGSQTVVGAGFEFPSLNPAFDPAASLTLTIGNIVFGHEDDVEASTESDIPSLVLVDGQLVGLDFVSLFTISGDMAIGQAYDETDLDQDTSAFLATPHYFLSFEDDGSFFMGLVTGFAEEFDDEDQVNFLNPQLGMGPGVLGNVVPEPSLLVLASAGLLGVALLRRR